MPLRKPHLFAATAMLVACITTARATELLVNGGFETGPAIPLANPIYAVPPGNTALTGWTVSGGAVSIVTDNYWEPRAGHRSLELSSSGPGAVEQWFASSPGSVYQVKFFITGEPFSSPTIKNLRVTVGATTHDFTYDVTPAWHWDMLWQGHSFLYQAVSVSTPLKFASLDASQWGPAIDSVVVEELPPSADVPAANVLALARVTPDPLQHGGRLTFTLPAPGRARLTVYDIQGRALAQLADGEHAAGPHTVELAPAAWGARPGVCVAVLHAAGRTLVRRFTVLR